MRKPLSKDKRQQVYNKYGGHCAYCGKEISLKEMQVDHATAFAQSIYGLKESRDKVGKMIADDSINSIDNLMPSCRQCNFYKGGWDIENLRNRLKDTLSHTCQSSFQVRLALQYGMLTYKEWDGKFYYEKIDNMKEELLQHGFVDKGDILVRFSNPRIGWKPEDGTLIVGYFEHPTKVFTIEELKKIIEL